MTESFVHEQYMVQKKFFKMFGGAFHIYDPQGEVAFYSQQKAFKLKEDIRLYTDEDMNTEVLTIKARKILDMSTAYDVFDPDTNEKVGALKRQGLKSMVIDEWIIMDKDDQEIGVIREDNWMLALVRRYLTNIIPQKYYGEINGIQVCAFKQNFNPWILKIDVDFSNDNGKLLDRRLGIAAAVLLSAIEGRQ